MDRRETFSWVLAAIGGIFGIVASVGAYHLYMNYVHEPRGALDKAIIVIESQNQVGINHYVEFLADCERKKNCTKREIDNAKERLDGLEWNKKYTEMMKKGEKLND